MNTSLERTGKTMTNQTLADIKSMYDAISQRFYGKPVNYEELTGNPVAHFETDLEAIMYRADDVKKAREELRLIILDARYSGEAQKEGMRLLRRSLQAVSIRRDWYAAIKSVPKGTDLSATIKWSFFRGDIKELARLHKANRGRKKIEALLEDCNFHKECADFAAKNYEEYL